MSELRIGNLIQSNRGEKLVVMGIMPDKLYVRKYIDLAINECNPKFVHPIHITGDQLIKYGFEQHSKNFTIQAGVYFAMGQRKNSKLVIRHTNADNWRVENFANKTIYLKYIHQLQNLYFVLTEKELKEQ